MKITRSTSARVLLVSLAVGVISLIAFLRIGHGVQKNSHSGPLLTFKGPVERTLFSNVQVAAIIQNGRLVDVLPLIMPNIDDRSHKLTVLAEPILRREAIAAGSAKIQAVTGASYTSLAYMQSLQGALAQVGK